MPWTIKFWTSQMQRLANFIVLEGENKEFYWLGLTLTIYANTGCLLYTSPSPRDVEESRMPSSA